MALFVSRTDTSIADYAAVHLLCTKRFPITYNSILYTRSFPFCVTVITLHCIICKCN